MKESIQGNINIRISEDEMTAFIDYTETQVLTEWSDKVVLDLLKDAGVTKGYKEFHFPRILKKIKKSSGKETFEIAHGVEAVDAGSAQFRFDLKPIPDSLIPVYDELLKSSDKPIVYPVLEDYVIGEQSQRLPFVTLNSYYVNEGDKVAVIDQEAKPSDGFTVTGKVLSPKKDEDQPFCLSSDFKIDKGKLVVLKSGFVRKGKNWIDLIPFKGHKLDIQPSDDCSEYFLTFTPGSSDAPNPLYEDIISWFRDVNYPIQLLKEEKDVIPAIEKSVIDKKSIKISLSKPRKAVSIIKINQSKTKAVLILKKGAGPGQRLSLKKVGALIRESKIKGINLDSLKKKILEFYKSDELALQYVILEGKVPTRGEPRRLEYRKEFISVDKIEGIVERIDEDQQAFYPSFKEFKKDDISSGIIVDKGFEFAVLTESIAGNDGTDIYGNKIKGLVGNDPIIKTFENITVKHDKYISDIEGILDIGEVNGVTLLRVRKHKDMFVDIGISQDAMSAHFTFYKEEGSGEPISIDFIHRQIEAAGIAKGIDEEVIEESFNKYQTGVLVSEVVFAKGKIPTDKKSSRIKYLNNNDSDEFAYEVEKGTPLAQIFPSKEKVEDGYDVLGTVMESSGLASLDLNIGENIIQEKQGDDSILLKSKISGEFKVKGNTLDIIDKKILSSDVSAKTGSIKTLCSLIVKGGVMSSLYVVSGGNIKIMGTVQGALISADKNIIIVQGVKGEDKAVLRAKEKVDVKFIEKGNIMAVDDVHIRKAALQAKIISNGKVLFDKNGSKIIGGETFTRKGIIVDEVGSPSGSKTRISFGQDYLVADKIKVFENDVQKIQEDLLKIDQFLHKPSANLNRDKVAHLRKQKVFLMKKLEKKNMKLFLLREKFEEHTQSEIVIRNKIYPGVVFESHGRILEIMDEQPTCKIKFNSNTGQIEKFFT